MSAPEKLVNVRVYSSMFIAIVNLHLFIRFKIYQ
jgi:hypothetical protein